MRQAISFVLPTYNCHCVQLVETLCRQCRMVQAEYGMHYEIVVADDCSTDRSYVRSNSVIERWNNVRYLKLDHNLGRSAVRNLLAREARHEWLVFIDGDLAVDRPDFVEKYALSEGDVVVGGTAIGGDAKLWRNNLRYLYEKRCEPAHSAEQRMRLANREFRTTNFLVSRSAVIANPFDEAFRHYGYEDVLFGKQLTASGHAINHIDNPVLIDDYESNPVYMDKTEEACRTLIEFRHQLQGYSSLLALSTSIVRWHLLPLGKLAYRILGTPLRRNLSGTKPLLSLFNIYRLLYTLSVWA